MTTATYGMFSEEGNKQIADLIEFHKMQKSTWSTVYQNLRDLADSDYEKFGEAMDTEVRECVYTALNFDTDFYI
jgi:hypothetical protein